MPWCCCTEETLGLLPVALPLVLVLLVIVLLLTSLVLLGAR